MNVLCFCLLPLDLQSNPVNVYYPFWNLLWLTPFCDAAVVISSFASIAAAFVKVSADARLSEMPELNLNVSNFDIQFKKPIQKLIFRCCLSNAI
jgi:hypothetical protein